MKQSFYALLLLLLASCGVPEGQLRIRGTYESFRQGADLLILSTDGGLDHLDTLHIIGGEFEYTCDMNDQATYSIIYADNSQLTIWAHSGDDIRIKENGQGLWNVNIEGNEENELYTQFRLQNTPTDTTMLRKAAAQFIRLHPASAVSQYLLCQYFVLTQEIKADSIDRLYDVIQKALPQDPKVATLGGQIRQRSTLRKGNKLPSFDLVTLDSVHHTLKQYHDKNLVLYCWAGWHSSATYMHHALYEIQKEFEHTTSDSLSAPIELLSYSLDIDTTSLRINRGTDELKNIPTFCDLQGFNSPYANRLGVRTLPLIIVVGKDGKILDLCSDAKAVREVLKKK